MRAILRLVTALTLTGLIGAEPVRAQLFYNGSSGPNFTPDGKNLNTFGDFFWYDNFVSTGWQVSSLFGVYIDEMSAETPLPPAPTQAYWEIRSGVGQGNGGTLLFSGTGALSWTPFLPSWNTVGIATYLGRVDGLNFSLPAALYWMMIAPIGDGSQFWTITETFGTDGVNPLIDASSFGVSPGPFVLDYEGAPFDFSYGVDGTSVVPEPASLALLGTGLAALGVFAGMRRRRRALG